jgi:hypothetical protein
MGTELFWRHAEDFGPGLKVRTGKVADSVQGPRRSWAGAQGSLDRLAHRRLRKLHRLFFRPHGHFMMPLSRIEDLPSSGPVLFFYHAFLCRVM